MAGAPCWARHCSPSRASVGHAPARAAGQRRGDLGESVVTEEPSGQYTEEEETLPLLNIGAVRRTGTSR